MNLKNLEMVRLKKIEIFGFKSFADKTELEFNKGVTAVVGPNGCGKSNIADAFRWVLGEQSAKSMRGSKMPDVIFAGTTHRKALNFAEVTITLCNECGALPIEFSEVAVTRRLHRNGESEYFINKNLVRMKDIQSLFLDSGMGKNTFSIFEQGKIDQVINFSALERRYIFEEAAGILRFLQRKREALKKLEETDHNTSRVRDIHKEEEKNIAVLETQAEKARVYKENKAALEILEKTVFVCKWDKLSKTYLSVKEKETLQKDNIEEVKLKHDEQIKLLNLSKSDLATSEKILKTANEEFFKARSDKEIKSLEKKTNAERLKEVLLKQKSLKAEIEAIIERRKLGKNELKTTTDKQKLIEIEFLKDEEKLKVKRESLMLLEAEISKLRARLQKTQGDQLKLMQLENQFESELKQNSVRFENIKEKLTEMVNRKSRLDGLIKELSVSVTQKKKDLDDTSDLIDARKNVFFELEERLELLSQEIKGIYEKSDGTSKEIVQLKAREKALNRLKEDMEGFSVGSKQLLQESKKEKSPLYKKVFALYEFIKPKDGAEKALSAVMRPYAETLVVKEKAHFEEVTTYAADQKLTGFSLVCMENLKSTSKVKNRSGDIQYLKDQIFKSDLSEHFLCNVALADTTAKAFLLLNEENLTVYCKDGSYIDENNVIFYISENATNTFLREADLKKIETELAKLESLHLDLEKKLKNLEMQKVEIQRERVELDKIIRKQEMTLVEINFGLQHLNGDLIRYNLEKKQIADEELTLTETNSTLVALVAEIKQKHIEAKLKVTEIQKVANDVTDELTKQTTIQAEEAKVLAALENAFQKSADENRKLIHALNVFEIKHIESETQEKRLIHEIESNESMHTFILSKTTEFDENLEFLEKALQESSSLCSKSELEVQTRKNKIGEIEKQIAEVLEILKKMEKETHQSGISLAQTDSFLQSLREEVKERYQLTIDELIALNLPEKPFEHMEKQIRMLKQQIDEAGDINMTSIEQLTKHQARYQFLNDQLDDLDHSKQELIQIITELDQESRKIFKETFETIRLNFIKNFKILFNGGEADLEFTESGDILEAGIEIAAKPPGKQMRSISLLSGGEKCLTAMALLFAIFEVKPAPFCILDEIDAPLDDSNVERFVNVVKQFTDRCQFIIITHNKRTMAIADVLFGVSMEERGVSKLLSIEFTKREAIV